MSNSLNQASKLKRGIGKAFHIIIFLESLFLVPVIIGSSYLDLGKGTCPKLMSTPSGFLDSLRWEFTLFEQLELICSFLRIFWSSISHPSSSPFEFSGSIHDFPEMIQFREDQIDWLMEQKAARKYSGNQPRTDDCQLGSSDGDCECDSREKRPSKVRDLRDHNPVCAAHCL